MKKIISIFIVILILTINLVACGYKSTGSNKMIDNKDKESNQQGIFTQYKIPNNNMPQGGVVSNRNAANAIAETILLSIYGETIKDNEPFDVKYDDKYQVWIIKGVLKGNKIGGVPNIIIQKIDGKVLAIWHTK